jgi:Exostosin family
VEPNPLKLHALSAYDPGNLALSWLQRQLPTAPGWSITPDPAAADLILFTETYAGLDPYFLDVIRHPVFRAHRRKCVLHHISDVTLTLCRTLSPSIDRHHPNARMRRSFSYVVRVHDNPWLDAIPEAAITSPQRRYLFSFAGDPATHPIRRQILDLSHPRALLQAATGSAAIGMHQDQREPFQTAYLQTLLDSDFVLCPRGIGPTSMRLFEVMQLGRVPVILSDAWVPVAGVPWDEFALFVPEGKVATLPALLERHQTAAAHMGQRARAVWLQHFAPDRALPHLLQQASDLLKLPHSWQETLIDHLTLASPRHTRLLVASLRRRLVHGRCALPAPS